MDDASVMHRSVTSIIRERILLLDYPPGQILTIRALSAEMGTSSTVVREALIVLEGEGLVRRAPNRHAYVSEVGLHDLIDVFDARLMFSDHVVRLATQRITPEEIDELRFIVGALESNEDRRDVVLLDTQFHHVIARAAHNRTLELVDNLLRNQMIRLWYFVPSTRKYVSHLPENRKALIAAMEGSDVETATRIAREHVLDFVKHVKSAALDGFMSHSALSDDSKGGDV